MVIVVARPNRKREGGAIFGHTRGVCRATARRSARHTISPIKCEHWTSLLDFLPPCADLQPLKIKTAEHSYTDYEDKLWVGGKNLRVSYSVANPLPAQPALLCVSPRWSKGWDRGKLKLLSVVLLGERQPIRRGSWRRRHRHGRREAEQKMRGRRDLRPHVGRVPSDGQTIRSSYHQPK